MGHGYRMYHSDGMLVDIESPRVCVCVCVCWRGVCWLFGPKATLKISLSFAAARRWWTGFFSPGHPCREHVCHSRSRWIRSGLATYCAVWCNADWWSTSSIAVFSFGHFTTVLYIIADHTESSGQEKAALPSRRGRANLGRECPVLGEKSMTVISGMRPRIVPSFDFVFRVVPAYPCTVCLSPHAKNRRRIDGATCQKQVGLSPG
jgi:hypothetical protein